ncbi:MAG: gliding motility-associated C-terminal domain-containing protein [Saprospiraceae bacterium]|nr:gliding motility-associated C-terminal domain-containing protein [Saprospiraceae bacterium]
MKRALLILVFGLGCLLVGAQQPFKCTGQYYITQTLKQFQFERSGVSSLVINPGTDDIIFTPIPNTAGVRHLNAMGYRITDNLIYVLDQDDQSFIRLDANGEMEVLRVLDDLPPDRSYIAGACTPDGKYMVISGVRREVVRFGFRFVERFLENNIIVLVDLTDPTYPLRTVPMTGNEFYFHDMAFDPFTGICYGWDALGQQLVTVDVFTGETEVVGVPGELAGTMGSIFFDAFGNLYGYGDPIEIVETIPDSLDGQNTLFQINKETGALTELVADELAFGTDGCACPYTVKMIKDVQPRRIAPCSEVTYTFGISNASAINRRGLTFVDSLPPGMSIIEVVDNPFGGTVNISADRRVLSIENMTIPLGSSSLSVRAEVGNVPPGDVVNQAFVLGLPDSLGGNLPSDDPTTVALKDPTILQVVPLDFDLEILADVVCEGDTLVLEVEDLDAEYLWNTGSTESSLRVTAPGTYSLMATTPCDTFFDVVEVTFFDPVEVTILASQNQIRLGDSVILSSSVTPIGDYSLRWSGYPQNEQNMLCRDCEQTTAQPFNSTRYRLQATDQQTGCSGEDFLTIQVDRTLNIWVANGFTPNGDQINDRFFVQGQYPYAIRSFEVYNRWGIRVYEAENIAVNDEGSGWPGKAGGVFLPPDVFVWRAVFELPDGTSLIRSGDVTLVR